MNTAGWAVLALCAGVLVIVVVWVRRLAATVTRLAARVGDLEASFTEVGPLLADTRSALRKSENRNLRADDLLQAATGVTARADAASRLAYEVATNPLVRVLAWTRGVRRGLAALRKQR